MQAEYLTGTPIMAPYTPGADFGVGEVIVIGNHCRIAHADLKSGIASDLACGFGIYRMAKATGGSTAIASGVQLYWDDSPNTVTATAGSLKKIGVSVSAAADADGYVLVLHMPSV